MCLIADPRVNLDRLDQHDLAQQIRDKLASRSCPVTVQLVPVCDFPAQFSAAQKHALLHPEASLSQEERAAFENYWCHQKCVIARQRLM